MKATFTTAHILPQRLQRSASLIDEQRYLLGLRGFLVVQTFLWAFLQTFVPTTVKNSNNDSGSNAQVIVRKTLSVLFWNEPLIFSSIILLSARTICVPFLKDYSRIALASAAFRRGIRLWFPCAVALAMIKIIFSQTGLRYIDDFRAVTENRSFATPYDIPNTLAYFNSVFNLFWTTFNYRRQAGSTAFPTQTLWIVSLLYQQSYTIYVTMVIIPYTRSKWRVKAYMIFIATAWWVQSWAWYSITGLLLADAVVNMDFKARSQRGIHIWRSIRCPSWVPYVFLMGAGLLLRYIWTAVAPEHENDELIGHGGLYYRGAFNTQPNPDQPQARIDIYALLVGFLLCLEHFDFLQKVFSNRFLLYLGSRSFSYYLMQCIIIYTAGIKLFSHLAIERNMSASSATALCLVTCIPTTALGAEIFYRLVDRPSQILAHVVFEWILA
ncbi:MAG: hypothetical protein M1817_004959 [Caeruleum heppii]|nr:MAG: hypothetical protein M1817_004959 [Caeruleum heppii]